MCYVFHLEHSLHSTWLTSTHFLGHFSVTDPLPFLNRLGWVSSGVSFLGLAIQWLNSGSSGVRSDLDSNSTVGHCVSLGKFPHLPDSPFPDL